MLKCIEIKKTSTIFTATRKLEGGNDMTRFMITINLIKNEK